MNPFIFSMLSIIYGSLNKRTALVCRNFLFCICNRSICTKIYIWKQIVQLMIPIQLENMKIERMAKETSITHKVYVRFTNMHLPI